MRTRVNQVDANAILSAWTPAKGLLSGTLSTDLDLVAKGLTTKEILPTLTAAGLASLSQGTLGPGPALDAIARFTGVTDFGRLNFSEGSVPFQVQNGRLAMRQVTLDGPSGDWKLAGSIGFDGTLDYIVSATIPPHLVAQLGAGGAVAAGALQDGEGRVFIDLRVTGPAESPRVAWDKGAMADRLRGRISQALQDQQAALTQQALNSMTGIAAGDSAASFTDVQSDAQALVDSLKKVSAGDFLKGFFGGSKDDDK